MKSFAAMSLRRQLLTLLLPLYVVAALAAMLAAYASFAHAADFFIDNQMRVFANSHLDSDSIAPTLRPLTDHEVEKGDLIVQIWSSDGRLLATSWPKLALARQSAGGFRDVMIPRRGPRGVVGGQPWRTFTLISPNRTVQTAQYLPFRDRAKREQGLKAGMPFMFLIPISAFVLWLVIRLALRRLELVARAAAAQDEHSFGELPAAHVSEEIRPLVLAVNRLLARLREAFLLQRRFVQDAAHELRTPITAMSLQLENLKSRVADETVIAQVAQLEAGLSRTKRLVEQLLRLARQDAPRVANQPAAVELGALLKEILADFMPLADRREIDLGFEADIDASVHTAPDELRSLIHNLLDNALRYTPRGGTVDVRLRLDAGRAAIEILDSGPGIPEELLPRVFDRFFRIEGSDTEGSGLGLAIAKGAAERNGIEIDLSNRGERSGLLARVRFSHAQLTKSRLSIAV